MKKPKFNKEKYNTAMREAAENAKYVLMCMDPETFSVKLDRANECILIELDGEVVTFSWKD